MCVCVADKDKGPWGEVEVANGVRILLLKLMDGGVTAGKYVIMDSNEVGWAFLELVGMDG